MGLRREAGGALRGRVRRCPRNCKRRAAVPFRVTGLCTRLGKAGTTAMTRKPGDLPSAPKRSSDGGSSGGSRLKRVPWRNRRPGHSCRARSSIDPSARSKQVTGRCLQSCYAPSHIDECARAPCDRGEPPLTRRAANPDPYPNLNDGRRMRRTEGNFACPQLAPPPPFHTWFPPRRQDDRPCRTTISASPSGACASTRTISPPKKRASRRTSPIWPEASTARTIFAAPSG